MSLPVVLLVSAALFGAWGLLLRAQRRSVGCGGCTSACHRKESRHG